MTDADDQIAVRNLLARIVYEGDGGTLDSYRLLLDDDVVWSMPGVAHHGIDDLLAGVRERRAGGMTGPGSGKRHVLTTSEITIHGDDAHARSTWLLVGDDAGAPSLLRYGLYTDVFRRSPTGWLLAGREISFGGA